MSSIIGKWEQPQGQAFPGLWFEFKTDGSFQAELAEMGITSGGSYKVDGSQIDLDQTRHTFPQLIGKFCGLFSIADDTLIMNLGDPGGTRPNSLDGKNKRLYKKIG